MPDRMDQPTQGQTEPTEMHESTDSEMKQPMRDNMGDSMDEETQKPMKGDETEPMHEKMDEGMSGDMDG